ncbi:MAG TPA: ROK family protein [Parafilimonas sp.]|nr:ROK family protein [Parafilimonas sp.]
MQLQNVIGIDLGATNIRGAIISDKNISPIKSKRIKSNGTEEEVLEDVYALIDDLKDETVSAIGIGVPSVVDIDEGIVYDVVYIPSWKEVHLKKFLEQRYKIPVYVNNDANCFVLGEYYFGKGKGYNSVIGATFGTGLGAGVIINNKLFAGANCGAGEFGMCEYLDKVYEYYCSGSFFKNVYNLDGEMVFNKAKQGDKASLELYKELGIHIGNAIKLIMYTYDPQLIILGGSVSNAYSFFHETMWQRIKTFAFTKTAERIKVEVSELKNSGVLGAGALCYDQGIH